MPTRSLPENPSLENLRKQAKRLRKAVRDGDAEAVALVNEFHPPANDALSLANAQLVIARMYRFASWSKLKKHIEVVDQFTWSPPAGETTDLTDKFIRLACMDYASWNASDAEKARRLLAQHPELAQTNIYTAATVGDVSAARAMLADNPTLEETKGGPFGWEPLLYACYSRLDSTDPAHSTLEVARLLIDHGADPNAGFLWCGNVPPFTALTGAFGEGEGGQPPHQHRDALARLLLDAGADPNDGQTLYNRHFKRADDHLTLLFSHGLGQDLGGPWFKRLGDRLQSPGRMLVEELWFAARKNYFERVKLLIAHGTDVNTPGVRDGRTPYQSALLAGNNEIAAFLLEHGAKIGLDPVDTFGAACIAGRRAEALAMIEHDPKLLETLDDRRRIELLHRAVETNHPEGLRLMAELGFDLNGLIPNTGLDRTAMHDAAFGGKLELVKTLIALGADPNVREPSWNATPIGWANHGGRQEVIDYLLPFASIFDAVQCGGVEQVATLLQDDPSLANAVDTRGNPLAFHLHPFLKRLDAMIELLQRHGADFNARNKAGQTLLDVAIKQGEDVFAEVLRRCGAATSQ